jgi:hypothetical protein
MDFAVPEEAEVLKQTLGRFVTEEGDYLLT